MKTAYIIFGFIFIGSIFSGCKFYFNESDYLGTYTGDFNANLAPLKDCSGQVIISDAGDFKANFEIVTDSNPTIYFTNITILRGSSIGSNYLRFNDAGYNFGGSISRTSHMIYLTYHQSLAYYYDYRFEGTRQ